MSIVSRVAAYTVRIAAVTATAPVVAGAAASAATVQLVRWELRQLASSSMSAEARLLKAELRERATVGANTPRPQQEHAENVRQRHSPDSTPARSDKARAQPAASNSSR